MLFVNPSPEAGRRLDPADAKTFGPPGADAALGIMRSWPAFGPTPLRSLSGLSAELGLASLHAKDETGRMGLGAFKALGGAYAVVRLVLDAASRDLGRPVGPADLASPGVRAIAGKLTFACATAGNHGRSIAFGAGLAGARCVTFVHGGVSQARADALAALGAQVTRLAGTYDEAVEACTTAAAENGWTVVSDTAWQGYEEIPTLVMQGYSVLAAEALVQCPAAPTHVFLQAGVGGLAAAVSAHVVATLPQRPRIVVVEPDRAACLLESARTGAARRIPAGERTAMGMLECYAPSLIAHRILARAADAFMTVSDEEAALARERLARPVGGDPTIEASESAAAGLAALVRAAADRKMRRVLDLDQRSRVMVIVTEGIAHLASPA